MILRQRQREKRIADAAAAVRGGYAMCPDERCWICRRRLTDETSIARAVGPVCWHRVLEEVQHSGLPGSAMPALQGELRL